MKFLHCSDIHLGRKPVGAAGDYSAKRYTDYFEAFDYAAGTAIRRKADMMIIAGDLFDKKELIPEVVEKAEAIFVKLRDAGVTVVAVEGNHDNITAGRESESWIIYLENKGLLRRPYTKFEDGAYRFYPVTIDGVNFWGLGYPGAFAADTIDAFVNQLPGDNPEENVVLIHTAPVCPDLMTGTVDYDTIKKISGKAMYVAAGHFHNFLHYPKDNPWFFIPGSLESWELSEHSQKKGMVLFDTGSRSYEFIPSRKRNIIYRQYTHTASSPGQFLEGFIIFLDGLAIEKDEDIVCLEIVHNNSFYLDTAACEEMLRERGALKAAVKLKFEGSSEQQLPHAISSIEQIERDVVGTWEHFSADVDLTARTLEQMRKRHEEGLDEQVQEIFDSYLDTLLNEGGRDADK